MKGSERSTSAPQGSGAAKPPEPSAGLLMLSSRDGALYAGAEVGGCATGSTILTVLVVGSEVVVLGMKGQPLPNLKTWASLNPCPQTLVAKSDKRRTLAVNAFTFTCLQCPLSCLLKIFGSWVMVLNETRTCRGVACYKLAHASSLALALRRIAALFQTGTPHTAAHAIMGVERIYMYFVGYIFQLNDRAKTSKVAYKSFIFRVFPKEQTKRQQCVHPNASPTALKPTLCAGRVRRTARSRRVHQRSQLPQQANATAQTESTQKT